MPQKPQVRAKNKRRLTKRLAEWRAKNGGEVVAPKEAKKADAKS